MICITGDDENRTRYGYGILGTRTTLAKVDPEKSRLLCGPVEAVTRTEPPANLLKYTRCCKNRHPSKVWGCSDDSLTRRSAPDSGRPVGRFAVCASPADRASGQSKQTCVQIAPFGRMGVFAGLANLFRPLCVTGHRTTRIRLISCYHSIYIARTNRRRSETPGDVVASPA